MTRYTGVSSHWQRIWSRWNGTWILELSAIAFSLATFVGLLIILSIGNGKTVWNGVTLNGCVSILATASKLAALFALSSAIGQAKWAVFWHKSGSLLDFEAIDSASRGALGCAQLLFHTRHVALLGAFATILAFGFDPFAQQLVQYQTVTEYDSEPTAKLPFTQRYSGGNLFPIYGTSGGTGTGQNKLQASLDYTMQAAALCGLVMSADMISEQLSATCPSGDCKWPSVNSLAICSKCFDLHSLVKANSSFGSPSSAMLGTGPMMMGNLTALTLPNGLRLDNINGQIPQLKMSTLGTALPSETCMMKASDTLIWSMTMMRTKPKDATAKWPEVPVESRECALYYCVQQYNTSMTGNRITEIATEMTTEKRSKNSWQPQSYQGVNQSQTLQFLQSLSWSEPGAKSWYTINRTDLMLGSKYNISNDAVKSLSYYFWSNYYVQTSLDPNISGYLITRADGNDFKPDAMQVLYDEPDLDSRFAILAKSMSNAMRVDKVDGTYELGAVGKLVTKYRIEWPWISLPVLVVLASIVQLLMIIKSSKNLPLWKSSILASLSRGPYVKDVFHGAETVAAMRAAAARDKVYLFEDDLPSSKARAEEYLLSIASPSLSNWTNDSEQSPLTPYRSRFDSTRTHRRNISESSTITLVNNAEDSPYSPAITHFKDVAGHRRGPSDLSSSASAHES